LRLKRLILKNFLSYDEEEQDFSSLNKVLIIGTDNNGDLTQSNGVGKTNFVNAIGWAIWGESKAKTLDENVKYGKDICSVQVDFEHENKNCTIIRTRNKSQKISSIDFLIDGEPSNGKSVTETNNKIIEFLKVDYRTYVNSVFLRQNDIYSLANPEKTNEGRNIIERVLNLDEYDLFEKSCKLEIKELEKEMEKYLFFIDNNKDLEEKINKIKNDLIEKNQSKLGLEKKIIEANKELKESEKNYNDKKEEHSKFVSFQEQMKNIDSDLIKKSKELEEKKLEGKKEYKNKENKEKELTSKILEKEYVEKQKSDYLKEYEKNKELKNELNKLESDLQLLNSEQEKVKFDFSEYDKKEYYFKSETKKENDNLQKALKNLDSFEVKEGDKCPTCFGDVTNHNIEDLKKHKEKDCNNIREKLKNINESLKEISNKKNIVSEILKNKELQIKDIQNNINNTKDKIISDKQHLLTLSTYDSGLSQIIKYEEELKDLKENKFLIHLKERCNQLSDEIELLKKEKENIEVSLKDFKRDSIDIFENQMNEKKKIVETINKELYTIIANIKNGEESLKELNINYKKYLETLEKLKNKQYSLTLLEQLSFAFSSKGIRSKILEDAIKELELESDNLLKKISDNKLSLKFKTKKEIDEEEKIVFEVLINKDNKELPYHLLSGGEQLRISFVIRIALSKMLLKRTNSKIEFLIIDEAVSPLDKNGVENIMEIIDEFQNDFKTILVITHRDDIKNMFDQVITIIGDENGSRIQIN